MGSPALSTMITSRGAEHRDRRPDIARLPLETKVAALTGRTAWTLHEIAELGLRPISFSDGPIGVRGITNPAGTSAQAPAPSAFGATWDETALARFGTLMAGEARRMRVSRQHRTRALGANPHPHPLSP